MSSIRKRGANSQVQVRLAGSAQIRLSEISARPFVRYRDLRLELVGPAVVRRELSILHHMFEIAIREWGFTFLKIQFHL